MNSAALLSVFILSILTFVSAVPTLRHLRVQEARVAAGQRRDICISTRTSHISTLSEQLSSARKCRYAGLPFNTYESLRNKCQNRWEQRAAVEKCSARCSSLRRDLEVAVSACKRIRQNGTTAKKNCPKIGPLRKRLSAVRARKCPRGDLLPTEDLLSAARATAERRRVALGLPAPAYELTVLEPIGHAADSTIIVLHGFGQNVGELVPVIRQTQTRLFPRSRFVLPQANEMFVDSFGRRANSWWNTQKGMTFTPPKAEVLTAARNINDIAHVPRRVHGIKPERVLVYGASQGASLALTLYLRYEVGAIVSQSGPLVLQESYPEELDSLSKDAPALVLHGSADESVSVEKARKGIRLGTLAGRSDMWSSKEMITC